MASSWSKPPCASRWCIRPSSASFRVPAGRKKWRSTCTRWRPIFRPPSGPISRRKGFIRAGAPVPHGLDRGGECCAIDAHQHFWAIARGDYGWMESSPHLAPIRRDFYPVDFEAYRAEIPDRPHGAGAGGAQHRRNRIHAGARRCDALDRQGRGLGRFRECRPSPPSRTLRAHHGNSLACGR